MWLVSLVIFAPTESSSFLERQPSLSSALVYVVATQVHLERETHFFQQIRPNCYAILLSKSSNGKAVDFLFFSYNKSGRHPL